MSEQEYAVTLTMFSSNPAEIARAVEALSLSLVGLALGGTRAHMHIAPVEQEEEEAEA